MLSLEELEQEVIACRLCPRLVYWREKVARDKKASYRDWDYWGRPVPGFGDPGAEVLVVGLAPAAHGGNRTGRIFTGDRSGDWLYRALWKAGFASQPFSTHRGDDLSLSRAYVTASVRCAPPGNRPLPEEKANCSRYLRRELELLTRVRVIVALGSMAYESVATLSGLRPRPRFGHGVEVELPDRKTLLCSYHPSQQNTFTGKLTEEMLDSIFQRARDLISTVARS